MRLIIASLLLLATQAEAGVVTAPEKPIPAGSLPAFQGTVDPAAFRDKPWAMRKPGIVTSPATARLLAPGITKDTIRTLIGSPHFGEGITRTWNYVLRFYTGNGTETLRCRLKLVFVSPDRRIAATPAVIVDRVIWQDRACADRVSAAG